MRKFYDCGIDLGTTNSCISVPNNDNTCTIIDNIADRMQVTPSVVWISKTGRTVIGQRAYTCTNTNEVRKEFKRDMGTDTIYKFESSNITKSPEELSSEILKSLRRDAESRTNKKIRDVVVTIPAAFNINQREATKKAAELAGFNNVILLQEPIAASIAYGAQPDAKDQYWLVFDYGGGTLDVSIISTNDGQLDNITSKGNNRMGGKDLDRILLEEVVIPKLANDYNLSDGLTGTNRAKIMLDIERLKIELSNQENALFETFTAEDNSGNIIDGSYSISREEFEAAITPTINEAVKIAREALISSNVPESMITKIILVGGTTYVPLVRKKLQEEFNIPLDCSLNPMTVVSEGAALFAAFTVVEEEILTESVSTGEFLLDLEYSAMTSEHTANIIGKILDANGIIDKVKIDCIANENSESALWTSGWCELLDPIQGVFDIDVQICSFNSRNTYRVSAVQKDGTACNLVGYIFEIGHKDTVLELSAPPLPYSIGVLSTDGVDNKITWLIKKDTKLPIKVTETFILNKTLDPSIETEFEILIYEGENTYNPPANHLATKCSIKSTTLTRVIEAGTKVEVTMSIDKSGCMKVTGYIPIYSYDLVDKSFDKSEENKTNYQIEMDRIEKKFDETKYTLD